ncbi:MAG: helix-turn-helix transcriptional regulator [Nitrospirota bacterium]
MNIKKRFGLNLKNLREQKGWSQEKLAEKSGLHRTYISGLERGIRNPTIDILQEVANALGVTPSDLLKDKEGA